MSNRRNNIQEQKTSGKLKVFAWILGLSAISGLMIFADRDSQKKHDEYVAQMPVVRNIVPVDGCAIKFITALDENQNSHSFYIARCDNTVTTTTLPSKNNPMKVMISK